MSEPRHQIGTAKGGFWLAVVAIAVVLAAGPGRAAGWWGARAASFLVLWGRYQGLFAGAFSLGAIVVSRRKAVLPWALAALVLGFSAFAASY